MLGSVSLPGCQLGSNPNKTFKKHGAATCLVIGITHAARSFLTIRNCQLVFVVVVDLCNLEGQSALWGQLCGLPSSSLRLICAYSPFSAFLTLKSLESPLSLKKFCCKIWEIVCFIPQLHIHGRLWVSHSSCRVEPTHSSCFLSRGSINQRRHGGFICQSPLK